MKIFGFSKKKEHLLKWQQLILTNSPNKLILTEEQLLEITQQQAANDLRINNDNVRILQSTVSPKVFFSRLELFRHKLEHLMQLEPYII